MFFRRNLDDDSSVENLVEAAKKGSSEAFGKLYDRFVDSIYRFVFFKVGAREVAEDLTQTVFLKAFEKIGQFNGVGSFSSWLFSITRNLITDNYRLKGSRLTRSLVEEIEVADNTQDLVSRELLEQTIIALGRLRQEEREVVILHSIEELDYAEIEKIMNKSTGALRILKHRALKKLKEKLDQ